ncbi:MAG: hypothetical protein V8S97_02815 [Oscillospiraceae bacterium]
MPNHVTNVLTLHGESDQIRAMLEAIQYDDLGIGSVDFNKIIPMPESLNIEAGSQTSTGLKAYQDFIEVYTLGGTIHQDDLENIPRKSEDAFLRQRSDIRPKEWKLGKAAWNNIRLWFRRPKRIREYQPQCDMGKSPKRQGGKCVLRL